jgi:predicted nucleotidyltransferase
MEGRAYTKQPVSRIDLHPQDGRKSLFYKSMSIHGITNLSGQAEAAEFANEVAHLWKHQLGQRLVGVYLIGSLAHGGFSARYSDIDMALIAEGQLEPSEFNSVNRKAAERSAGFFSRLSLFWADQLFSVGRFPLLDKVDYIDHAVPLLESRRVYPVRPALTEIRTYLREEPFRNWSKEAQFFSALSQLTVDDHKRYLRALLYPARFWYSWETGAIGSNDRAVTYLQGRAVDIDIDLILRALFCRNQVDDPRSLFSERSKLLHLYDRCKQLIASTE